MTERTL